MQGYGFSTWIVPDNWKSIQVRYSMKHIPHITVRTNLTEPSTDNVGKRLHIKFVKGCFTFPKQYEVDPLDAYGFYCTVKHIEIDHIPHMSLFYNEPLRVYEPPMETLQGTIHIADTRSLDPSKWKLITHPSIDLLVSLPS